MAETLLNDFMDLKEVMDELALKISNIIGCYENNCFGQIDAEHVLRWVNQFDPNDQLVVLQETNRILKKNYITRQKFEEFISTIVTSNKFTNGSPSLFWKDVSLLNIQKDGNSQRELVDTLCNKVAENLGFFPNINSVAVNYVYIDDFLFTGGRLINDLQFWVENNAPQVCHIDIVYMGWYQYGIWRAQNRLKEIALNCGKNITFKYWSLEECRLENRKYRKDYSHVFWPEANILEHPPARVYFGRFEREIIFRAPVPQENKIFSQARRNQYENAMIKAGLEILGHCQNPSPSMKPLGFSWLDGFGFGSTVFSYRNCPNNNPLAFWWGDPNQPHTTLGRWYPLMQRTAY